MFEKADIVHRYTREQAIADGVLVDVSCAATLEGFTMPVAFTRSVYGGAVAEPSQAADVPEASRLREVLADIRQRIRAEVVGRRSGERSDRIVCSLPTADERGVPWTLEVVVHCGPGDRGEPVLTVLQPDEN